MSFYNTFSPPRTVYTAPDLQLPPVGTAAYCALSPTDEKPLSVRDSACKNIFGLEYGAQPGDYYSSPNCIFGSNLWTTKCRRGAASPRTGDVSKCCINLGVSSDGQNKSCPIGSNDPRSPMCSNFWLQRCNTDPNLADSSICKYMWDAQTDPAMMGPFVRNRCFSAARAPSMLGGGDVFCTQCAGMPQFKDDVAAVCNNPKNWNNPGLRTFCKNWCKTTGNPGACDASMPEYCASAEGKDDPACGCFSTFSGYDTDPELKALKTLGMTRCADPCTNGQAYLTKSASTIGTCCAQLGNITQSQAAMIGGVQLANINQKLNCGLAAPAPEPQPPQPQNQPPPVTVPSPTTPTTALSSIFGNKMLFFILILIVIVSGVIVALVYTYFSGPEKNI